MLANPRRIGAVFPSGRPLARAMARAGVRFDSQGEDDGYTVELGAGTGVVTRALLDAGIRPERLLVVELEPTLADFLRRRFPACRVIEGDARRLADLLPPEARGRVRQVVSSLPLRGMPAPVRDAIVDACFAVLPPDGPLIQYTYPPFSPLPMQRLGLAGAKVERVFANLPPAAVWRFHRKAA